jgi:hypothetical protein
VQRELGKRIGAPYYMVTFTLPEDLRALFFSKAAPDVHQVFVTAASRALAAALAGPRWLGAATSGFTNLPALQQTPPAQFPAGAQTPLPIR